MSITLPTYTRREMPLLSRGQRVRTIISTGLRREFKRPATIVVTGFGAASTAISSLFVVLLANLLPGGPPLDLSFFYQPASNPAILFFTTLMAAVVGSGLISDDLDSMALTLYLSRPISHADYLIAKGAILAPLVSMIAILPLVITPLIGALLGLFPWIVALQAMGISAAVGLLLTAFYTSVSLFLSSLTRRKSYAAAGVFAINFGLTLPVGILAAPGAIGNPALFYLSPWDNYLAVARAAFGAPGAPIDWAWSLSILLVVTVLTALVTHLRMKAIEVVSG